MDLTWVSAMRSRVHRGETVCGGGLPALRNRVSQAILLVVLIGIGSLGWPRGVYQEPETFLQEMFEGEVPEARILWLIGDLREQAREILGHDPAALRVRYWSDEDRTVWILEEVGKERPITVGLTVAGGTLRDVRILIFRESRGWEVRYPFFTDQFRGVRLLSDYQLDRHIDGVSGATLSVRAVKRLARLALLLHEHSEVGDES